jgi:hypothetical protein
MAKLLRPRSAAAFFGMGYSTFNAARIADPDFAALRRGVPLGERAIGFDEDDCLKVKLIKECRRDSIADCEINAEVERRFVAKKAQELRIAEAAQSKPKSKEVANTGARHG